MQLENPTWMLPIEPREVQLDALNKGFGKPGFAYFLRQRLGKTWLSYNEYYVLRDRGVVDWFFLICPNSIKEQWVEAIEQVDPYTPIHVYEANAKYKTKLFFHKPKSSGVFIINYESMKAFMANLSECKIPFDRVYLVADESTKIKEPTAKMTKACLDLAGLCPFKRVLTGRPSGNSNADFWAQLKFIDATDRSFYSHKLTFCAMGGYRGNQVVRNINESRLRTEMAPYSYIAPDKYLKGFEKIYEPMRRINMSSEQLAQYKQMEDELVLHLGDVKVTATIALTKYLRLQQISSGIVGDVEHVQRNAIEPFDNPRIRIVRDIINSEIENKVIIACRFRLSVDNVRRVLMADGHKVAILMGGMGDEIEREKEKFNKGDCNILVAQLQVLAYGHNLAGNRACPCDSMIFYENDFSLLNRIQCESRPENADSEIPISYYDMYASKMDRYILECLRKKEDASMAIMGYARKHGIRPVMITKEEEMSPDI